MADLVEIKYIPQRSRSIELAMSATYHTCVPTLYHLWTGKGKEDGKSMAQTVFIVLKSSIPSSPVSLPIREHGIYGHLFRSASSSLHGLQIFFLEEVLPIFSHMYALVLDSYQCCYTPYLFKCLF